LGVYFLQGSHGTSMIRRWLSWKVHG
jgi:hypothetical protein